MNVLRLIFLILLLPIFVNSATQEESESQVNVIPRGKYCYHKKALTAPKGFKVSFSSPLNLWVNDAEKFSIKLVQGRRLGCYLFSLKKQLSGDYFSGEAFALDLVGENELKESGNFSKIGNDYQFCSQKQPYKVVQFYSDSARTKKVFRMQCEFSAYEFDKPIPFAPSWQVFSKIKVAEKVEDTALLEVVGTRDAIVSVHLE